MLQLSDVLGRGYFPKELPPPFKTVTFGNVAAAHEPELDATLDTRTPVTRAAPHSLARAGDLRRQLAVPNPLNYFRLSRYVTAHWAELSAHVEASRLSISTPVLSPIGRALNPRVLLGDIPGVRASYRATSRYVLMADIARFYPSLYTHSIPWALHGKPFSKANRGLGVLGNDLDALVRSGQDGQTNGIPISPDVSLLIAETVLSAADAETTERLGLCGFRHLDDYELGFSSLSEAEAALATLEAVLKDFELALNASKTRVCRLPEALEDDWVAELNRLAIRASGHGQRSDLISYFNRAFELAKTRSREPVLSYAVARLRRQVLVEDHVGLAHDLILQTALSEPATLRFSLELLIRHRAAGLPMPADKLNVVLRRLIGTHAPLGHGSEVAWALWAAIALSVPLDDASAATVSGATDPFVAVLACDALARGMLPGVAAWDGLRERMTADALRTEDWLIAYEADVKGWCNPASAGYTTSDPFFGFLAANDTVFYDSETELAKISKPAEELTELQVPVVGFVFGY